MIRFGNASALCMAVIIDVDKVLAEIPVAAWGKYNNRFKIGDVKITLDGSPPGRTAAFTTPYLTGGPGGEKNWKGEPTFPQELANKMVKKVYDLNVPLILHCNGDAAIDAFLQAYAFARVGDYSRSPPICNGKPRHSRLVQTQATI